MLETVIILLFFLCLNLLFAYKPIPIMAFPVGIATIGIFTIGALGDTSLPYQPYTTVLFILIVIGCLIRNALEVMD